MKYTGFLILLAVMVGTGFAQPVDGRRLARLRRSPVKMRAEAPRQWDKSMKNFFAEDAFTLLVGERNSVPLPPPPPVPPQPVPQKPFDRKAVMKDLEKAEVVLAEVLSNETSFRNERNKFDEHIKSLDANTDSLVEDESEYRNDDTYMDMARSLQDMVDAVVKDAKNIEVNASYEKTAKVFKEIKQACDKCHRDYR